MPTGAGGHFSIQALAVTWESATGGEIHGEYNLACDTLKGEVSPNNNVDWVSRKQFYKPNSKSLNRFG